MSTIIILGVAMFTFVILAMVFILLAAKARLVNSEAVTIGINHDPNHSLRVPAGNTLLNTLASNKIFIPSACGGKGSCGVCKVIVKSGGGSINPTELGYISKGEAREGCRLSCQVKVKQDMEIEVHAEIFGVRKWKCHVKSNNGVATFIKEFVLSLPEGEVVPFRAGGYIQNRVPAPRGEVLGHDHRGPVPRRVGQVQPLALRLHGPPRPSPAPTRWRTTRRSTASSC